MSSFPLILLQNRARDENQDTKLTTVDLTPNSHSNFQTRFVIPRNGSILDSNSSLIWDIAWDGFSDSAADLATEIVTLKQKAGGLPTLRAARFYIGGREIFTSNDTGHKIHIRNLTMGPDHMEEMLDKQVGSSSGYLTVLEGKYEQGPDAPGTGGVTGRYSRRLGKGDKAVQCSVKLSEIFSALESLQLPMNLDEMRVEIDWETEFDQVATTWIKGDGTDGTRDYSTVSKTINIVNPRLLLDFVTFDEERRAGLAEVLQNGMTLPFVHTSMSSKVVQANLTATERTDDVLLALQGKLVMKMYVSHRWADSLSGVVTPYQQVQGRCRSQRGLDMKYNLFINDISVHDLPVDTTSKSYTNLVLAAQDPVSIVPGFYDRNDDYAAAVEPGQVVSQNITISDIVLPGADIASGGGSDASFRESVLGGTGGDSAAKIASSEKLIRDSQAGTQSYIGFDLAKYDEGSRVVPANAGYRIGSSAVILRLTQKGGVADTPQGEAKTVQVFTEEVRFLRVANGVVDITEA